MFSGIAKCPLGSKSPPASIPEDLAPQGGSGHKAGKTTHLLWLLFGDSEFYVSILNLLTQHLHEKMEESRPLGLCEAGPNSASCVKALNLCSRQHSTVYRTGVTSYKSFVAKQEKVCSVLGKGAVES